jgi:molybdopterin molybdotransferase
LTVIGEVAAGGIYKGTIAAGQTVEIMTGAPVPAGADAVVMVEHCRVEDCRMEYAKPAEAGLNISRRGTDSHQGDVLLPAGSRIRPQEIALLATNGSAQVAVFRRPRVAIVGTGDELVGIEERPEPHQIRNSNSHALAAQVARAGGEPWVLPVARDTLESTLPLIENALTADMVLLSGGVSAGKYDVVEIALMQAGAEFHFDRVLIQPGQPLVFGHARGKPFFGLPGNPASTLVCFELFARAALDRLAGLPSTALPLSWARLAAEFSHKPGLTRFLPARLNEDGTIEHVRWSGSGDIPALTRSNCFLVAEPGKPLYAAGDWIQVLNA